MPTGQHAPFSLGSYWLSELASKTVRIVGAGVAGLTAAAELCEYGFSVTVFEKGEAIGAESCSRYAGGMLAPYCERESAEEAVARLGEEAAQWWEKRVDGVASHGSLVLAQPRDRNELARFSRRTENFVWLDENGIGELEPCLKGRFRNALYFQKEAHLDPRKALLDLGEYLQNKGVSLITGEDGHAQAGFDITIDATGFAARKDLKHLRGVKGEMLILRTTELELHRPVRMLHPRTPIYIVPRANHRFMVGATMIESEDRHKITARSVVELLSAAYALDPAFGEAELLEIGADVRPAFPDNLPRITFQKGVYYLNGLYRHGFLLAPALARMMREILIDKQTSNPFFHYEARNETDDQRKRA